jgi:hypothetical protein
MRLSLSHPLAVRDLNALRTLSTPRVWARVFRIVDCPKEPYPALFIQARKNVLTDERFLLFAMNTARDGRCCIFSHQLSPTHATAIRTG